MNKTPLNTFRIPHLLTMFPNARFIHLVRDGRAVTHSYAKKQRRDMNPDATVYAAQGYDYPFADLALKLAAYWQRTIDEVALRDQELNLTANGRLLEIRYIDLCTRTDAVLEQLCRFMGVKASRLKPEAHKIKMTNQNYKWRKELSPDLIEATQRIQKAGLKRWGYI